MENVDAFLEMYINQIVDGKWDFVVNARGNPTFPSTLKHINTGNKDLDTYVKRNITSRIVKHAWSLFSPMWYMYHPEDPRKYWEKFLEQELR